MSDQQESNISLRQWCIEQAVAAQADPDKIVDLAGRIHTYVTSASRPVDNPDLVREGPLVTRTVVEDPEEIAIEIAWPRLIPFNDIKPDAPPAVIEGNPAPLVKYQERFLDSIKSAMSKTCEGVVADIQYHDLDLAFTSTRKQAAQLARARAERGPETFTDQYLTHGQAVPDKRGTQKTSSPNPPPKPKNRPSPLTQKQEAVLTLLCALADEGRTDITLTMIAKRMNTTGAHVNYPMSVLARRGYVTMTRHNGKFFSRPLLRTDGAPYKKRATEQKTNAPVIKCTAGAALGYTLKGESDTLPSGKKRDRSKEIAARKSPRVTEKGKRSCLSCGVVFASSGAGNRLCPPCKKRGYAL